MCWCCRTFRVAAHHRFDATLKPHGDSWRGRGLPVRGLQRHTPPRRVAQDRGQPDGDTHQGKSHALASFMCDVCYATPATLRLMTPYIGVLNFRNVIAASINRMIALPWHDCSLNYDVIQDDNFTLAARFELRNVSVDDAGWYECLAVNWMGNSSQSTYLHVHPGTRMGGSLSLWRYLRSLSLRHELACVGCSL